MHWLLGLIIFLHAFHQPGFCEVKPFFQGTVTENTTHELTIEGQPGHLENLKSYSITSPSPLLHNLHKTLQIQGHPEPRCSC